VELLVSGSLPYRAHAWLLCPGGWESARVEVLEMGCWAYGRPNALLKTLPASLGRLGALKQLTLELLDGLEGL
jgi:hypothetical protein